MLLSTTLTTSIGWTIWAGGLALVGARLHYHFRPKIKGRLAYQWDGRIIAGKEKEDLPAEITTALKELGNPYTSTTGFVIWNPSDQILWASDIVEGDPIRVELGPKDRFLRIQVQSETKEANAIQVWPDPVRPNVALISFRSLGPGDGIRVEMLHTGLGYALTLEGSLCGALSRISNFGRIPLCDDLADRPSWWVSHAPHMAIAAAVLLVAIFPLRALAHLGHRAHWFLITGGSGGLMNLVAFVFNTCTVVYLGLGQFQKAFGRYPKSLRI